MLKMLALVVILFTSTATVGEPSFDLGEGNTPADVVCPTMTVACPEAVNERTTAKFELFVGAVRSIPNLKYRWTVNSTRGFPRGRIKSGQGKATILVSAPRGAGNSLTAAVTLKGLPKLCPNKASCTTMIASPK